MANKHKGSNFEDFLSEEGLLDDVDAVAIKRVIAHELTKTMKKKHINKTNLAAKLRTSRSALDRLLDPNNTSITLNSLVKAAHLLGKKLRILFV
ncbi:MAG: Fis family transcriptional regulator [Pseudomonadota bacterium]